MVVRKGTRALPNPCLRAPRSRSAAARQCCNGAKACPRRVVCAGRGRSGKCADSGPQDSEPKSHAAKLRSANAWSGV
jgi:hypothetical protein